MTNISHHISIRKREQEENNYGLLGNLHKDTKGAHNIEIEI